MRAKNAVSLYKNEKNTTTDHLVLSRFFQSYANHFLTRGELPCVSIVMNIYSLFIYLEWVNQGEILPVFMLSISFT